MKLSPQNRGRLVLAATFAVALVLSIIPGPVWAESFRPDWVGLVLIYWCIATPHRVGVGTGWIVGLIQDVLYGSLLGQNALAKTVIAFIAVKLHLRMRIYPPWQQAVVVLFLLAINQLLVVWVRTTTGSLSVGFSAWTPSIVGMVVWPWLFVILRDIRRRGQVK